jgi:hypothetical protein
MSRDDEVVNTDEPPAAQPETYDPSWAIEDRMYPDFLGYILTCALGLPVTTAGDGIITDPDSVAIPATAYRHVWTAPFGPAGAKPKTFQADIAYGDQSFFMKMKGAATQQIELESPPSGGCRVKASGPALYLDDQSDPSLTPAYEADTIPAFIRAHLTLPTWLSGTGKFQDFAVQIGIPLDPAHEAGSGSRYPNEMYKGDGPVAVTFSVPKSEIDLDDWNALVAATGFAAKALWTSTAIIASAYPYKFYVEGSNAQYLEGDPEAMTNKRRLGSSFSGKFTRAGSASATLTLINATASYA